MDIALDTQQLSLFDYASLDTDTRVFVQEKAQSIQARLKRTAEDVIAIGLDLIDVKEQLGHGKFLNWIDIEFSMSDRHARRFMAVAEKFGKSDKMSIFPVSILYELAAPSTPDIVVGMVESGQILATLPAIREAKRELQQPQEEVEEDEEQAFKARRKALENEGFYYIPEQKRVFDAIDAGIIEIDLDEEDDDEPIQENLTPEQFVDEVFPGLRQEHPRIVQSLTTLDDIFPGISEFEKQGAPVPESWKLPQEMRGTPAKSTALLALQSSESNEWYTPAQYVEVARELMGGIDLDPASNDIANQVVQATLYYDIGMNGLKKEWRGRVWLNPPYGFTDGKSNQEVWTNRLIEQYKAGVTTEAVLLVNANTEAKWFQPLYDYLLCFTNHRIRFYNADGNSSQPTQGNALVYFGSQEHRFISLFQQFGVIIRRIG